MPPAAAALHGGQYACIFLPSAASNHITSKPMAVTTSTAPIPAERLRRSARHFVSLTAAFSQPVSPPAAARPPTRVYPSPSVQRISHTPGSRESHSAPNIPRDAPRSHADAPPRSYVVDPHRSYAAESPATGETQRARSEEPPVEDHTTDAPHTFHADDRDAFYDQEDNESVYPAADSGSAFDTSLRAQLAVWDARA
ncbi:hypothetical protein C8J57DRAFT_1318800 [Mycena rebaudengoi]|nr:hypothetical protein C8J57DRAFT_1318800 [Mycena rebaudengoi]